MKDRLAELAEVAIGMCALLQPAGRGQPPNPNEDKVEFRLWMRIAGELADKAADYESPKFRAIAVVAPQPEPTTQHGNGKTADIIDINDPVAAARVYRRIVSASGGGR